MALLRKPRLGDTYPPPKPERIHLGDGDVTTPLATTKRRSKGTTTCKPPKGQEVICASQTTRYDSLTVDVCLVRQKRPEGGPIISPVDAVPHVVKLLADTQNAAREVFVAFFLNRPRHVVGARTYDGAISEALLDTTDVLRAGILLGAESLIIAHNHPSGLIEPSNADLNMTTALYERADILSLSLIDSLIVSPDTLHYAPTTWYSMRKNGAGPFR
jgi:DNA repair protein RadC